MVLGSCNYKLGLNRGKEFKTLAKTSLSLSSDRKHTFLLSHSLSLSIYTQTPSTSHTLAHKRTLSVSFERCPLPLIICLALSHSLSLSRTLSHSLSLSLTLSHCPDFYPNLSNERNVVDCNETNWSRVNWFSRKDVFLEKGKLFLFGPIHVVQLQINREKRLKVKYKELSLSFSSSSKFFLSFSLCFQRERENDGGETIRKKERMKAERNRENETKKILK